MTLSARTSRTALWTMAAPVVVLGAIATLAMVLGNLFLWPLAVICLYAFFALLLGFYGKYPALVLGLFLWMNIVVGVMDLLPFWLAIGLGPVLLIGLSFVGVAAGLPWGQQRLQRLQTKGHGTIESEWVYVPRDFAVAHPLYRLSPGIWLVALLLISYAVFYGTGFLGLFETRVTPYVVLVAVTLLALWFKAAVASPLVYISLLGALPLSIPFLFYWADGVRPNLIYRHRYQRLCLPES